MKKLLIGLGLVLALLVGALVAAPALIPVEAYKPQLLAQIERATGREARIDGALKVSLLPNVALSAEKVSLANATGAEAPVMASIEALDVQVAVFPLLSGTVEVKRFVLRRPVINLEVDKQGRPNWQFADGKAGAAPRPDGAARDGTGGDGTGLGGLRLDDVRLVEGRLSYRDARSGAHHAVEDVNMSVSLPALDAPLKADGALVWNSERITLTLDVENPNAFLNGNRTGLAVALSSNPVKLGFKGEAAQAKQLVASGDLDLDVPSVRNLAAWAGQPLQDGGKGFGVLRISGRVGIEGQSYSFTQAKLKFDEIEGTGNFRYENRAQRPYVSADLATNVIDINPYLPPPAEKGKGAAPAPSAPAGQAAGEWSDEPIDLSALRQVDVDAKLAIAGLVMREIRIGKSRVVAALKGGRLTTRLEEMALYKGNGTATVVVDGSANTPAISAQMKLAGIDANAALTDAIGLERLEGRLDGDIAFAMRGGSQRAMVSNLNGKGQVKFLDGAVRGINLGAMVRNVTSAFLDPKARETQKTDFAELSGSYMIANGILKNDDLTLLSPLLRVGGRGTVNIPRQTVDYRVEPRVVATTEGQGGKADVAGIMVPVVVSGPWSNLSYKPDLSGILKDPSKALEGLKGLLPGGRGGGTAPSGEGERKEAPASPLDQLKGLFGR